MIIASFAIVFLLPLLIITYVLIKLESPGPALFRQKRYGKDKKIFTVYKFRSMRTTAPRNIPTNDFHDAHAYITRVGRIIRKLSIDELPQLINVLQGHMSLVGPRPVVLTETSLISERGKYGANNVKPGITGWAQVNGRDDLDDGRCRVVGDCHRAAGRRPADAARLNHPHATGRRRPLLRELSIENIEGNQVLSIYSLRPRSSNPSEGSPITASSIRSRPSQPEKSFWVVSSETSRNSRKL